MGERRVLGATKGGPIPSQLSGRVVSRPPKRARGSREGRCLLPPEVFATVRDPSPRLPSASSTEASVSPARFLAAALKHRNDKPSHPAYPFLYQKYGSHLRDKEFKLFEIGLGGVNSRAYGNGSSYTPGRSLRMWWEYFPMAEIHIAEWEKMKFGHLISSSKSTTTELFSNVTSSQSP